LKSKENKRLYHNKYAKKKYIENKEKALAFLGGKCVHCSSTEFLEFDHIDPSNKVIELTTLFDGSSWKRILEELIKCQLLCNSCHKKRRTASHGTYTRYVHHKCRCDLCKKANAIHNREYKLKRKKFP